MAHVAWPQPKKPSLELVPEGDEDEADDEAAHTASPDVLAPVKRAFERPTSDMLVVRRGEWWATVLADVYVMQEMVQAAVLERMRGRNKWTTVGAPRARGPQPALTPVYLCAGLEEGRRRRTLQAWGRCAAVAGPAPSSKASWDPSGPDIAPPRAPAVQHPGA